ncbi:hypothetical protein Btru_074130 [Bulinus truncatus]|nr:hypothetical protein Btru_074130 [Bulinus truncatus]
MNKICFFFTFTIVDLLVKINGQNISISRTFQCSLSTKSYLVTGFAEMTNVQQFITVYHKNTKNKSVLDIYCVINLKNARKQSNSCAFTRTEEDNRYQFTVTVTTENFTPFSTLESCLSYANTTKICSPPLILSEMHNPVTHLVINSHEYYLNSTDMKVMLNSTVLNLTYFTSNLINSVLKMLIGNEFIQQNQSIIYFKNFENPFKINVTLIHDVCGQTFENKTVTIESVFWKNEQSEYGKLADILIPLTLGLVILIVVCLIICRLKRNKKQHEDKSATNKKPLLPVRQLVTQHN